MSFYYEPDLSAGSFRAAAFVGALAAAAPEGSHIDIVTTQPNRYRSFSAGASDVEHRPGVSIHRVKLPEHQSGVLDQPIAFVSFARAALSLTTTKRYDLVFATSGRLMTAALGAFIARRKNAPLFLDIRDIFVDTISDVVLGKLAWIARPVFRALERWTVNRATRVNLVSRGFQPYFTSRYPAKRFSYITNGVDEAFLREAPTNTGPVRSVGDGRPITVLYAGNIGECQTLDLIIPALAQRMGPAIRFGIIGDGSRREALQAALAERGVDNAEVLSPVPREVLLREYRAADVLFLQLADFPALTTVIPSKLFEYAALGKPVWAGVAGFTATFVREEITNAVVFRPSDVDGAVAAFANLRLQEIPRTEFCAKFSRARLSRALAESVLETAREGGKLG